MAERCRWSFVWLFLAAAVVYLAGNGRVCLWDRDEPRYAQTSRQMLHSGDWVVPMLLDTPRLQKPIFIYWTQAAAMKVFGDGEFAARLPSSVAMLACVGMVYFFVRRATGEDTLRSRRACSPTSSGHSASKLAGYASRAFWAALVFATCLMTLAAAKMAITDGVLLAFVLGSQIALYTLWRTGGAWPAVIAYAACVGFAGLTKGPVVLGVNATTVGVLLLLSWNVRHCRVGFIPTSAADGAKGGDEPHPTSVLSAEARRREGAKVREGEEGEGELNSSLRASSPLRAFALSSSGVVVLKSLLGLSIIAAILALWVVPIERTRPGTIRAMFNSQVVERVKTAQEGHSGPPGYYFAMVWPCFFPWSLFLPPAIWHAWKRRRVPLIRFSLAAILGPWVMLELVKTKLPHYLLPVYPFLGIVVGDLIVRAIRGGVPELRQLGYRRIVTGVLAVLTIGMTGGLVAAVWLFPSTRLVALVALPIVVLATATHFVNQFFSRGRLREAFLVAGGGTLAVVLAMYLAFLPYADFIRTPKLVGDRLLAAGLARPGDAIAIEYKEDSLGWYSNGLIRQQSNNAYLNESDPAGWPRFVVTTRKLFERVPEGRRARWETIGEYRGLVYSKGKVLEVVVLKRRAD